MVYYLNGGGGGGVLRAFIANAKTVNCFHFQILYCASEFRI